MISSGAMPYFSVSRPTGALGDSQLALAREGLRLLLVFVDAAHDQRRAVRLGDGAGALEFFFAVLEVDGVDDGLALAIRQRQLDRRGDRWCRSSPAL